MARTDEGCYRDSLALAHHHGSGGHADRCAPGILALLEPVRARGGLVLELGCGSGLLTRHLVAAGHRVIATDASPAMLRLARRYVPGAQEVRRLTLPDDPLPAADAIVSVGHALSYLPGEAAVHRALAAAARALRPGGVLAVDLWDLEYGVAPDLSPSVRRASDWAVMTTFTLPAPDRVARDITVFTRTASGCWHRDDEHHENVLVDTSAVPALLAAHGVQATVGPAFGAGTAAGEPLPAGLAAVTGTRRA